MASTHVGPWDSGGLVDVFLHLPIYKAALDMAVHFEKLVAGFPRFHKYTLGTELREASRVALMQVLRANNSARNLEGSAHCPHSARAWRRLSTPGCLPSLLGLERTRVSREERASQDASSLEMLGQSSVFQHAVGRVARKDLVVDREARSAAR